MLLHFGNKVSIDSSGPTCSPTIYHASLQTSKDQNTRKFTKERIVKTHTNLILKLTPSHFA